MGPISSLGWHSKIESKFYSPTVLLHDIIDQLGWAMHCVCILYVSKMESNTILLEWTFLFT